MRIYRGKRSSGEYVYGPIVTGEYLVTIADGEYRNIINKDGEHVVYADTVEFSDDNNHWTKLPSKYAEQRKRVYEEYHKKEKHTE